MKNNFGIHWFRRDLRVVGNAGLRHNWKVNQGKVVGIFCFDQKFLSRSDFSNNRFAFFLNTLVELKKDLKTMGSDLIIIDRLPLQAFSEINKVINDKFHLNLITYSRDYEPFARQRDESINQLFESLGLQYETFRDHLVIEPNELVKDDKKPYQIYSPFARKWMDLIKEDSFALRINPANTGTKHLTEESKNKEKIFSLTWSQLLKVDNSWKDKLEEFIEKNNSNVTIEIPKAGADQVKLCLKSFKSKLQGYGKDRDIPSVDGTSMFSLFLKNGSLTTAQIISYYQLHRDLNFRSDKGEVKFLKELIWREFYYHIMHHFPRVENEAFIEKFKNIQWKNNERHFKAWCEGNTGYPIVDAGMRQLKQTGWMHNRVRMIVASFLTKDLLIDWRWGERHFMKYLLDGDLAPNNGGWQWAASTGCDPQPYFRVFNPWLQSKKFDPEGLYIKKFVPELAHLDSKKVHEPHLGDKMAGYPEPIVDHSTQRQKALTLYKVES